MENALWQLPALIQDGMLESYLAPLHRKIPMTATTDIGAEVATLLLDGSGRSRVVEIEGPERYSSEDLAGELSSLLDRSIKPFAIPRDTWHDRFVSEGSADPGERIAMLDGFNSGWIDFEGPPVEKRIGRVPLRAVLKRLLHRS
jgi:uncharacterized protein YbjT (DUF2867 family)